MPASASAASGDVVVLGAGGHAKVCVEILRQIGSRVYACIVTEEHAAGAPSDCLGVPVLVGLSHLDALRREGVANLFAAIGDNGARQALARETCATFDMSLVNAISPSAAVAPSARLGRGVVIMRGAVVSTDVALADLVIVNGGAVIEHDCIIGESAHVAPGSALGGGVVVGARTLVGIGSSVIPRVKIGNDVVVGAGSAVVRDVLDRDVVVGVPARPVRRGSL